MHNRVSYYLRTIFITLLMVSVFSSAGCAEANRYKMTAMQSKLQHDSNVNLIFVHGLGSSSFAWDKNAVSEIAAKLNANVYFFDYDSNLVNFSEGKDTYFYAKALGTAIDTIHNNNKSIIVAHSQGGIIALRTMYPNGRNKVSKLVLLGTPTVGSKTANSFDFAPFKSAQQQGLKWLNQDLIQLRSLMQKQPDAFPNTLLVLGNRDSLVGSDLNQLGYSFTINTFIDTDHSGLHDLTNTKIQKLIIDFSSGKLITNSNSTDSESNTLAIIHDEAFNKKSSCFQAVKFGLNYTTEQLTTMGYTNDGTKLSEIVREYYLKRYGGHNISVSVPNELWFKPGRSSHSTTYLSLPTVTITEAIGEEKVRAILDDEGYNVIEQKDIASRGDPTTAKHFKKIRFPWAELIVDALKVTPSNSVTAVWKNEQLEVQGLHTQSTTINFSDIYSRNIGQYECDKVVSLGVEITLENSLGKFYSSSNFEPANSPPPSIFLNPEKPIVATVEILKGVTIVEPPHNMRVPDSTVNFIEAKQ